MCIRLRLLSRRAASGPRRTFARMILRADHLVKKYKARTVVNDMSVTVGQGEIVGLLGPNGAGKTTCFYMMVGMVKPNSGRIYLDNTEITTMPIYQRARLGVGARYAMGSGVGLVAEEPGVCGLGAPAARTPRCW